MPNFLEIKLAIFYIQFYKFGFLQFCPMSYDFQGEVYF